MCLYSIFFLFDFLIMYILTLGGHKTGFRVYASAEKIYKVNVQGDNLSLPGTLLAGVFRSFIFSVSQYLLVYPVT